MTTKYSDWVVRYDDLNPRQQENYNFQKVSAILADYGFVTMRLSDDWQGADFIAHHVDGETLLRIQLKGRLSFAKKYEGKGLHVVFRDGAQWHLYPHDELLDRVLAETNVANTQSWRETGEYTYPRLSQQLRTFLEPYRIGHDGVAQ